MLYCKLLYLYFQAFLFFWITVQNKLYNSALNIQHKIQIAYGPVYIIYARKDGLMMAKKVLFINSYSFK